MKTTKVEQPKWQPAYYVHGWANEIKEGKAFIITYKDWYEKTMAFFISKGETIPELVDKKTIRFSHEEAVNLLHEEKKSHKEYYERQIREANEKLKQFNL